MGRILLRDEVSVLSDQGFLGLKVSDWRQFSHVKIDFHPRLTILTGANASGKSTILGILARHLNWTRQYSSAPLRGDRKDRSWSIIGPRRMRKLLEEGNTWAEIGHLTYADGNSTTISVPVSGSASREGYDLYLPEQQKVEGVFINSHRAVSGNYFQVSTIPTVFTDSTQIFEQFTNELRMQWSGSWSGRTPQVALKEALIAAAVFGGGGNESVDYNAEADAIWQGFGKIMSLILPKTMGFIRLRVRVPDIIVETETGDFILDDASGGVSAIIEMAWQIFLRSRGHEVFTVILDEPENHLHPSLQRELLPSFLEAFPRAQFIVATHSPFVVTATPDSAVYVLDYNAKSRVESRQLDYANKSANADETLQRVLGLSSTLPIWAEDRLSEIIDHHLHGSLSTESMITLRNELVKIGLEADFPDAVVKILDSNERRIEG